MDHVVCVHFLRVLKLNSIVFQRVSGNWIPCAVKSEHAILSCSKCLSECPCPQRAEGNIPSCFGSVGSGIFLCSLNRQHAWNNSGWHLEVAFFKKPLKKTPFWLDLRGKSWRQDEGVLADMAKWDLANLSLRLRLASFLLWNIWNLPVVRLPDNDK